MGQTKVSERGDRSPWPTALLVVAAVAAASVAVGLTVVGPMLQRKWETPPPALALHNPAPEQPAELARAEAEVQIKERVIPRPKPKPPEELMFPLSVPGHDSSFPGVTGGQVSDGEEESGRASDPPTTNVGDRLKDAAHPRATVRGEVTEVGGAEPAGEGAKTRRRRLSPLEALPALGSSLPRTPAADPGAAGTAPVSAEAGREGQAGERDGRRTGRSYRVQVGRFADENDARRLRDELAGSGLAPQVVKTERDGVVLYRVQVGTFKMKENADRQVEQLKEQRYEPYIADEDP